jgi:hypothetical protein
MNSTRITKTTQTKKALKIQGFQLSYSTYSDCLGRYIGGGGGIRTHERLTPLPIFKTGAFNRSATPPTLASQALCLITEHRSHVRATVTMLPPRIRLLKRPQGLTVASH